LVEYAHYQVSGGGLFTFMGHNFPDLVLYANGHLLLSPPRVPLVEKVLTTDEVCDLLRAIEAAGFYDVTTDGTHRVSDPLYKLPTDTPNSYDAPEFRVLVNGESPKDIWVYEPYLEYLVPAMQAVLNLLHDYYPAGLARYHADRLILGALEGREAWMDQAEPAIAWPDTLPPLATLLDDGLYLEGVAAHSLYEDFAYPYGLRFYVDEGKEYAVVARPILPHEDRETIGGSGVVAWPSAYPLPFSCSTS